MLEGAGEPFSPTDVDFIEGKRVLIVDDEVDVLTSMRRILKRFLPGVDVATAESAAAGLEAALATRPDVLILDYRLGDRTGLELLADLRAQRVRAPVLLVSAYADLPLAMEAVNRSRVDYVFRKDSPPQDLLRAVNEALVEAHLAL